MTIYVITRFEKGIPEMHNYYNESLLINIATLKNRFDTGDKQVSFSTLTSAAEYLYADSEYHYLIRNNVEAYRRITREKHDDAPYVIILLKTIIQFNLLEATEKGRYE